MDVAGQVKRIIYLSNARLPTEKAHGYQTVKMCQAFAQNGADVLLLHPYRYQSNPQLREQSVFDYYGVPPLFDVKTQPNLDVIRLQRFLPEFLFTFVVFIRSMVWGLYAALVARKNKADLYYTRTIEAAFWLVRMGLPTVYEAHRVPKQAGRRLLRGVAGHPALRCVVVLTSFIKERLVELGLHADKALVLPDGVDLALFEGLPEKGECRSRLGLPQNRTIIGYVGRFHTMAQEKGIPELVEAMAHLPPFEGQEPLLLCVGGPMETVPAYLDFAARHGLPKHRLEFSDRVPSQTVPLYIRAFDLCAMPFPWTEHYAYYMSPLKLFEYMASGTPIVATDLPSVREILRDGENAVLVEPGSPKALAKGIRQVLEMPDRGQELAIQARQDVTRLTWQQRASDILVFANTSGRG